MWIIIKPKDSSHPYNRHLYIASSMEPEDVFIKNPTAHNRSGIRLYDKLTLNEKTE